MFQAKVQHPHQLMNIETSKNVETGLFLYCRVILLSSSIICMIRKNISITLCGCLAYILLFHFNVTLERKIMDIFCLLHTFNKRGVPFE